jgi:hypothetical protein
MALKGHEIKYQSPRNRKTPEARVRRMHTITMANRIGARNITGIAATSMARASRRIDNGSITSPWGLNDI